jgi:hypothetical protein
VSAAELLPLFGGTGGGIALVFCVLLITNVLYTKGQYADMRDQRDDMRAQRDEWKKTAELNAARAEAGVVTGKIVRDVMTGLRDSVKELE